MGVVGGNTVISVGLENIVGPFGLPAGNGDIA